MSNTQDQSGFTLIELLTVILIIGVLAGIALPQYAEYRAQGFDARAQSALRMVAFAEESYFVDGRTYLSCDQSSCPGLLTGVTTIEPDIALSITRTATSFTGTATHAKGTGRVFSWGS